MSPHAGMAAGLGCPTSDRVACWLALFGLPHAPGWLPGSVLLGWPRPSRVARDQSHAALLYVGHAVDHLGRRPQAVLGCFQKVVIAKRAPFLCRVRASRSLKPTEGYRLRRAKGSR